MSLSNSLAAASAALKDTSVVQDTLMVVAQNTASTLSAATDLSGKGGFSADATFGQLIEFQFTGLLVVFVVLGGLTLMCVLMAWILKTVAPDQYYCRKSEPGALPATSPAPPSPPAATNAPAPVTMSLHPGLADEEFIALLAVAATEVLGQAVSVVKFRAMDSMDWTWSVQGRVSLHASHKL